jgi:hypothetical protein
MARLRYRNLLSIRQDGKGVPYGGSGEPRADGEANYGFFNLKSNLVGASSVPELKRDPALFALARVLNAAGSGFLSLGSTSGAVADTDGHRWSGYMEFAINSQSLVADAANYFPIFFHFDRFLSRVESELQVQYEWELMGAHFADAQCDGFTCSLFINTHYVASGELAATNWTEALTLCSEFLSGCSSGERPDPIYAAEA